MSRGRLLLAVAVTLSLFLCQAACRDIYVKPMNAGNGTFENPYPDVSTAVENAQPQDRILLAGGVYSGPQNRNLALDFGIEIRAAELGSRPIIDLGQEGPFASFDPEQFPGTNATISALIGIAFENGKTTGKTGAALSIVSGSITIADCTFQSNTGDLVGAVAIEEPGVSLSYTPSSLVTFSNCSFRSNKGGSGAAVNIRRRLNRVVVFNSNAFTNNEAQEEGGAISSQDSDLIITHTYFYNNVGQDGSGGAISSQSINSSIQVKIYASDFESNDAAGRGGAIDFETGVLTLSSCIFTSNKVHTGDSNDVSYGAGVYVVGSALIDGCSFNLNSCGNSGSEEAHGGGLAISGAGGALSSSVTSTSFSANVCFLGSDIAVMFGAQVYFSEIEVLRTEFEGKAQIFASGSALFQNCNFSQHGERKQALFSAYVTYGGSLDFEWYPFEQALTFEIDELTIVGTGSIKTTANLDLYVLTMNGGDIMSTTTSHQRTLSLLEATVVSSVANGTKASISGFDIVNQGSVLLDKGYSLTVYSGSFTNGGQFFLGEMSVFNGIGADYQALKFTNAGTLSVDTTARIHADWHNNEDALLHLNKVEAPKPALTIVGDAYVGGNLSVSLAGSAYDYVTAGSWLPLLDYTGLKSSPFGGYTLDPALKTSTLVYDPLTLFLNSRGTRPDGLSGGEVALTVIAALVAAAIVGAAIWYFILRPQEGSQDYSSINTSNYQL